MADNRPTDFRYQRYGECARIAQRVDDRGLVAAGMYRDRERGGDDPGDCVGVTGRLVADAERGQAYFASSASIADTSAGSSGAVAGAKRAATVPSLAIRNFSKFHSTSGSSLGVMP